jgi:hypothetical protein
MKQFSKVRLITNKYVKQGANQFDVGYIIEVYDGEKYEIEFSDKNTGITYAMIVASEDELEEIHS